MLKINFAPNGTTDISWLGIPLDPTFVKGLESHDVDGKPIFNVIIAENFKEMSEDGGITIQNMIDQMQGAGISVTFRL